MTDSLRLRVVFSIGDIPAGDWNACALEQSLKVESEQRLSSRRGTQGCGLNPFISHEFLHALELSKSVGGGTGWDPRHLVAENVSGEIVGAVPAYLKSHSRGEYVFDRGWAEAYERAGGNYYPKLQVCVPFTPATGRRLLVRPGPIAESIKAGLATGLTELCRRHDASGVHVTFMPEDECRYLSGRSFLERTDQQFHWENDGYATFDAFLEALSARKRKTIKRERRDAATNGITIHWLSGKD